MKYLEYYSIFRYNLAAINKALKNKNFHLDIKSAQDVGYTLYNDAKHTKKINHNVYCTPFFM
jgi:hypothetical protein